ncbi:MAG: 30S ribosomal protein S6 [Verrucomicrobiales bacterium]
MKRNYEGVIVFDTQGREDSVEELISTVGKEMEEQGATLQQIDQIGKKEFAYVPGDVASGYYVNYLFDAEPDTVEKVRTRLTLNDAVYYQHYQRI